MEIPSSFHADTESENIMEEGLSNPERRQKMGVRIAERFGEDAAEEWKEWRNEVYRRRRCKSIRKKLRKENERHTQRIIKLEGALAENTKGLPVPRAACHRAESGDIKTLKASCPTTADCGEVTSMDAEFCTDTGVWLSPKGETPFPSDEQDFVLVMDDTGDWELVVREVEGLEIYGTANSKEHSENMTNCFRDTLGSELDTRNIGRE